MQPDPSQNNVHVQTVLCSRSATTHKQFVFQQRPTNTRKAQIAERFVESVLALWHVSAISSEVACTMFWWTGKVGLQGDVPRLALRFGRRSGNYKRHLDIYLGHANGRQLHYLLPVPSHKRHGLTRTVHDVPTMPMTCWRKGCVIPPQCHSNSRRHARMAPCPVPAGTTQLQHSCVASASFFRDGVAYSHTDSVLGVWPRGFPDSQEADVQVRVPGMVFPVLSDDPGSLVPKGHGGWEVGVECISTFLANVVRMPVLGNQLCKMYLTHQFTITQPRYIVCRYDGSNWRCNDQERASQGDESLGIKMTLVHIKSDWAEHCGTLGFPSWTSGLRPCFFCTASTDSWFTTDGLDSQRFFVPLEHPRRLQDGLRYMCDRCPCGFSGPTLASYRYSAPTTGQAVATGGAFWKRSLS